MICDTAEFSDRTGKKRDPSALALRARPQASNNHARRRKLFIIRNMRVPASSPVGKAHTSGYANGIEDLTKWTTSDGKTLDGKVFTSAESLGDVVYALISQ